MDLVIPPYYKFPANQSTFRVHGTLVTSKYKFIIWNCYLTQEQREYMVKKYEWSNHTMDQVWWKCHKKALDTLTPNDRIRIQQFIFYLWATNHRAAMYSLHAPSSCSACSAADETAKLILQCPTPTQDKLRQQWISELTEYMDSHHTPPSVLVAGRGTTTFVSDGKVRLCTPQKGSTEQHKLGWDHFIKGQLTSE